MLKIACAGEWHVHGKDFANKIAARADCTITAIWSDTPETGNAWADEMGCRFEGDYHRLTAAKDVDAIILTSSTASHREMIVVAANAKKHVFVEKALAVSNEDAYAIRDAVLKNGIHFTLSDPVMKPPVMFAKEMIQSGKLGRITNVRVRAVHDLGILGTHLEQFYHVDESGGGALIDMGYKSAHILYQLLGRPQSALASFETYTGLGMRYGADENAVALFKFDSGAIGIAETGWASPKDQFTVDVYGTYGSVCIKENQVQYRFNESSWQVAEILPKGLPYPLTYWVESILYDIPNEHYGVLEAVAITEMITAAYRSAKLAILL